MKTTPLAAAALAAMLAYPASFAAAQNAPGAPARSNDTGSANSERTSDSAARAAQPAAAAQKGADRAAPDKAADQEFVRDAANDNLFEIQAGQLAQQRAQGQEVKQFAQHLIQDHQQANQKLSQLAQSKGLEVPKELDAVSQAKLAKLSKLQGQKFDKEFLLCNLGGHVVDVAKFRMAPQELQDNELKQFAAETLPKLQMHLQEVQRLTGSGPASEAQPAGATQHGSADHSVGNGPAGVNAISPPSGDRTTGTPAAGGSNGGTNGGTAGSGPGGNSESTPQKK